MSKAHRAPWTQSLIEATGVDVAGCYQCGKCTAGCPMARHMDLSPNQVMRLAQSGDDASIDAVLRCAAIWCCAGCLTCTQRCPKQLDPAAVMDFLREASRDQGKTSPEARKISAFHEAFLKTVEKTGRMAELPLVMLYKLMSRDFLSDAALGPAMLLRGKLPLKPHLIKGRHEIQRIFTACLKARK